MTDEKKQKIGSTIGGLEKLIEDHPLTGNDRKNLLEGLGLIVEVLNEAFAPPKDTKNSSKFVDVVEKDEKCIF
jgi:hypothetical protein